MKRAVLIATMLFVAPLAAQTRGEQPPVAPCDNQAEGAIFCGELLDGYLFFESFFESYQDDFAKPARRRAASSPTYYVGLSYAPNWCRYAPGDRVFIHYSQPFTPDAWYIVPGSDPNQFQLATQFHTIGAWSVDWYVGDGCAIFLIAGP